MGLIALYILYILHVCIYTNFWLSLFWHTDCIHIAYIFLIFHLIYQVLFGLWIVDYHVILSLVHAATLYLLQVQDKRLTIILHLLCNACVNKWVIAGEILTCMCTKELTKPSKPSTKQWSWVRWLHQVLHWECHRKEEEMQTEPSKAVWSEYPK